MKGSLLGSMSLLPMRKFGDPVLPRRSILDGRPLELSDPAIYALTDFKRDYPMTVDAERQIDDALSDMIRLSVRALLVAKEQRLVGLITSYDIQGERPMQFLQSSNYSRHEDIRVVHVMTPWDELLALDWDQVEDCGAHLRAPHAVRADQSHALAGHRGGSQDIAFHRASSRFALPPVAPARRAGLSS